MDVWREFRNNPLGKSVGDCAIRAISAALDKDWHTSYALLAVRGYTLADLMNANVTWGSALRERGFERQVIPNSCPDCYTFADFAHDHKKGIYVLGTGTHVATVKDGLIWDSWDSSQEVPQYFWVRE